MNASLSSFGLVFFAGTPCTLLLSLTSGLRLGLTRRLLLGMGTIIIIIVANPFLDLGLDVTNPLDELISQVLHTVYHVPIVGVIDLEVDGEQDGKKNCHSKSNHPLPVTVGLCCNYHLLRILLESNHQLL